MRRKGRARTKDPRGEHDGDDEYPEEVGGVVSHEHEADQEHDARPEKIHSVGMERHCICGRGV